MLSSASFIALAKDIGVKDVFCDRLLGTKCLAKLSVMLRINTGSSLEFKAFYA